MGELKEKELAEREEARKREEEKTMKANEKSAQTLTSSEASEKVFQHQNLPVKKDKKCSDVSQNFGNISEANVKKQKEDNKLIQSQETLTSSMISDSENGIKIRENVDESENQFGNPKTSNQEEKNNEKIAKEKSNLNFASTNHLIENGILEALKVEHELIEKEKAKRKGKENEKGKEKKSDAKIKVKGGNEKLIVKTKIGKSKNIFKLRKHE